MTRDGTRCVASVVPGIVLFPYGSFRRAARRRGTSQRLSLARPYTDALPDCLVVGCGELVVGRQELCQYHQSRYFEDRRKQAARPSRALWAQGVEPFVRAGQF